MGILSVAGCIGDDDDEPDTADDEDNEDQVLGDEDDEDDEVVEDDDDEPEEEEVDDEPEETEPEDDDEPEEEPEATFRIEVNTPETVDEGETFDWHLEVENVGDATGEFEDWIEISRGDITQWERAEEPVVLEDLEPGETERWEVENASLGEAAVFQFRLEEHDIQWEIEVLPTEPDIQILESGMVEYPGRDQLQAEVLIENQGDGSADRVDNTVDWFDGDGNYYDSSDLRPRGIMPDERYAVRGGRLDSPTNPSRIETTVADVDDGTFVGDVLEVEETQILPTEGDVRVRFEVTNLLDTDIGPRVIAQVLTEEGVILDDNWTFEDFGGGETRTVEFTRLVRDGRVDLVEDARLLVAD